MKHTPTGHSAFENSVYYPKNEKIGKKVKGYPSTYKRIEWDKPALTITMRNDCISSQSNVHPGRLLKDGTYSDARALTLREIFILSSLNPDLDVPSFASDIQIRHIKGVKDWEHLFANTVHEYSYFFARIFNQFRIFDLIGDSSHNDGLLFKFRHGGRRSSVFRESAQDHNTFRNDAYESGAKYSGYISLNKEIIDDCKKLLNKFNVFDKPENGIGIPPEEWIYNLYDRDMMNYLAVIMPQKTAETKIINDINTMQLSAVQGNVEGTDFENSLKPVFELFRENIKVDVISGAGNPDLICIFVNNSNNYKVNVEAKSRNSFNSLNLLEPQRYSIQHNTKYAIVVAPRFTPRTIAELTQVQQDHNVVLLNSDTLGRYCQKECLSSDDGLVDYNSIDDIIINNKCSDISLLVDDLIIDRYGT